MLCQEERMESMKNPHFEFKKFNAGFSAHGSIWKVVKGSCQRASIFHVGYHQTGPIL
tara:strand:+ start:241 stop:411 length:171 start_codon:yes stop_codon:yes gene_type:complete